MRSRIFRVDTNVGLLDAIVLCRSNMQQGSNLSGVAGWMLSYICTIWSVAVDVTGSSFTSTRLRMEKKVFASRGLLIVL
jgi:hypothetical protein